MSASTSSLIARHRVGHRSRVQNLHGRIRAARATSEDGTPSADPLIGNYTLVRLEDIVLAYSATGETATLQAYPVSTTGQSPIAASAVSQGDSLAFAPAEGDGSACPMAVAVADFDGDGADEAVMVYFTDSVLNLVTAGYDDATEKLVSQAPAASATSIASTTATPSVRVASGYVDPCTKTPASGTQPPAQLVVAYPSSTVTGGGELLTVSIYGLSGSTPVSLATDTAITVAGMYDVATGDVDGDGVDEVVVAWQGAADSYGNTLFLEILKWNGTATTLTVLASAAMGQVVASGFVSVAVGTLNPQAPAAENTVSDLIALGWGVAPTAAQTAAYPGIVAVPSLAVWSYDATNTALLTAGTTWSDATAYPLVDLGVLRVTVGDLNQDGLDEIVLGNQSDYRDSQGTSSDILALRCFQVDNTLGLTLVSSGTASAGAGQSLCSVDLSMAIGAPTPPNSMSPLLNALVIACVGSSSIGNVLEGIGLVTVAVVQVGANLNFPAAISNSLGEFTATSTSANDIPSFAFNGAQGPKMAINAALGMGDFSGRSIRVGPPQYFRADAVNGIIALVNAAPTQFVNTLSSSVPANTFANFTQNTENESSFQLNVSCDWGTSTTLEGNLSVQGLGELSTSMTSTYGQGFSSSTEAIQSLTTGLSVQAQNDDQIILSLTDYDVWEYPVYQGSGESSGEILVVFPDVPPDQTPGISIFAGWSWFPSYYNPSHQILQVMSYPTFNPPDYQIANAIYVSNSMSTSPNQMNTLNVTYTEVQSSTNEVSNKISLDVSNSAGLNVHLPFGPGLGLGVNIDVIGTYKQNTVSTHEVEFVQSMNIMIQFGQLSDSLYQYEFRPLLYYSSNGGYIVLDYVVTTYPNATYWGSQYSGAVPAFSQPWNSAFNNNVTSSDGAYQLLTRSIMVTMDVNGDTTGIQATVLNYGLTEATGLSAQFAWADPTTISPTTGLPSSLTPIGSAQTVPTIEAQGRAVVSVGWTPPDTQQNYALFCTVSSGGASSPPPLIGYNMYPPDYFTQLGTTTSQLLFAGSE